MRTEEDRRGYGFIQDLMKYYIGIRIISGLKKEFRFIQELGKRLKGWTRKPKSSWPFQIILRKPLLTKKISLSLKIKAD